MENNVEETKVVRRIPADKRITTVLLGNDTPHVKKKFHCLNCGYTVFHYYSDVRVLIEGEMREVARPIDVACRRQGCKVVYRVA